MNQRFPSRKMSRRRGPASFPPWAAPAAPGERSVPWGRAWPRTAPGRSHGLSRAQWGSAVPAHGHPLGFLPSRPLPGFAHMAESGDAARSPRGRAGSTWGPHAGKGCGDADLVPEGCPEVPRDHPNATLLPGDRRGKARGHGSHRGAPTLRGRLLSQSGKIKKKNKKGKKEKEKQLGEEKNK